MQRQPIHVEKPKYSYFLSLKLASAALATFLSQPFRVLLYQAAVTQTTRETVETAVPLMFKDIPLNLARGMMGVGLQSIVKHYAHLLLGHDTWQGRAAGILGASGTGTLTATFAEVPFMRKNAMHRYGGNYSLWRVNPAIFYLCGAREFGFTLNVFGTSESPWYIRGPVLLLGTFITTTPQKLVTIEVTRDIRGFTNIPNFQEGILTVIRKISYGHYQRDLFNVLYENPKTNAQLVLNFLNATSNPHMFGFRLLFIVAITEALKLSERLILGDPKQPGTGMYGLFNNHPAKAKISSLVPAQAPKKPAK